MSLSRDGPSRTETYQARSSWSKTDRNGLDWAGRDLNEKEPNREA